MVARLEDQDRSVRGAALDILKSQSSLSGEILTAVARLLESESAGDLAESVLRRHKDFYSTLLSGRFVGSLLQILLRRSFEEQWSWYVEDKLSYFNAPDGIQKAIIDDVEEFKDRVDKAMPRGIPLMAVDSKSGRGHNMQQNIDCSC